MELDAKVVNEKNEFAGVGNAGEDFINSDEKTGKLSVASQNPSFASIASVNCVPKEKGKAPQLRS